MIRSRKPGADPAAVLCGRARHTGRRGELGTAIIEVTWLGLLLMIPLVYVIVTLVTVQRSAFGATEAARAAGRAFILAPDPVTARERAYEAARQAMLDQGAPFEPAWWATVSAFVRQRSVHGRTRRRLALPRLR